MKSSDLLYCSAKRNSSDRYMSCSFLALGLYRGWLEYKGQWYYLDPENGVMQTNRTIDGYQLDSSGVRI